jgi:hypothetical protein
VLNSLRQDPAQVVNATGRVTLSGRVMEVLAPGEGADEIVVARSGGGGVGGLGRPADAAAP